MHRLVVGGSGGDSRSIRRTQTEGFSFGRSGSVKSFRHFRRRRSKSGKNGKHGTSPSSGSSTSKKKADPPSTIPEEEEGAEEDDEEEEGDWCTKQSSAHWIPLQHKRALVVKTATMPHPPVAVGVSGAASTATVQGLIRPSSELAKIAQQSTATTGISTNAATTSSILSPEHPHHHHLPATAFLPRERSQVLEPLRTNSSKTRMDTVRVGAGGVEDQGGDVLLLQVPNGEAVEVVSLYMDDDQETTISYDDTAPAAFSSPMFMSNNGEIVVQGDGDDDDAGVETTTETEGAAAEGEGALPNHNKDHHQSHESPIELTASRSRSSRRPQDKYSIELDDTESRFTAAATADDYTTCTTASTTTGMTGPQPLSRIPTGTTSVSDYYNRIVMSHDSQASTVTTHNVSSRVITSTPSRAVLVEPDHDHDDDDDSATTGFQTTVTVMTNMTVQSQQTQKTQQTHQTAQPHGSDESSQEDNDRYTSHEDDHRDDDDDDKSHHHHPCDASTFADDSVYSEATNDTTTTYGTSATGMQRSASWRSDVSGLSRASQFFADTLREPLSVSDELQEMAREVTNNPGVLTQWLNPL